VKFVEVSAAGLATAISAYALAHFGGLLSSSPTPASAPAKTAVQAGPTAIANVDANPPAPHDAPIEPGLTDTRSAPVDVQPHRANMPPRQADVEPQPVAVPPRALPASPADVQPQPVETSPTIGADLQPRSPDVRPSPVDIQPRPVTAADPLPPRADPPLEISAPQPPPTADQEKGVFPALKRISDLLRPDPPAPTGETPRPPMPVGTRSPEIREFGN